jgi:redox-sensitive bicupin YhaK (pirin superfamily)
VTYLKSHDKDLGGGFVVRRLLPALAKQAVGPFIFFDHFGPIDVAPGDDHDVRPHPHIGLATVTYLYEGAIEHRDSIGSVQRIEAGAINWMTAGRGIVHSERTPRELLGKPRRSHGLQLWAALPRAHEEDEPSFSHTPAADIPSIDVPGGHIRILVGELLGARSPVPALTETLYLDIRLDAGARIALPRLPQESAAYVVQGDLDIDGAELPPHTMQLLDAHASPVLASSAGARLVIIGGEPLDGHRFLYWNFVSSRKERLSQAAEDWSAQRFDAVPGETEWIPLPARRPAPN